MSEQCDHAFKTNISTPKFEAVVAKSCRSPYTVEVIAHDPTAVPHVRIINVNFTSLEDRDRVRIALRFVEKEQADMLKAKSQPVQTPTLARRLASA